MRAFSGQSCSCRTPNQPPSIDDTPNHPLAIDNRTTATKVPRPDLSRASSEASRDTAQPARRLLSGGRWEEVKSAIWRWRNPTENRPPNESHKNLLRRQDSSRANRTQQIVPLEYDTYDFPRPYYHEFTTLNNRAINATVAF